MLTRPRPTRSSAVWTVSSRYQRGWRTRCVPSSGWGSLVLCAEPDWGTFLIGGRHSAVTERIQHEWIRSFQNPWIGRALPSLLADAGVGDIRQEALWLPTHGFAESDLLFEIDANAKALSGELPEALPWLESYRQGEAYAGVLMMICWGRRH